MIVEIPTTCPSCASLLERINDQLFCRNPSCGGIQVKVVESFAKNTKIRGLGIKTIEKLGLRSITDIYEITLETATDAIGEKLGHKLIDQIEKSKHTTLDVFLSSCSIYLIGQTVAKKLLPFIYSPTDLTPEICDKAGLGEKARESLMQWFTNIYLTELVYLPISFSRVVVGDELTDVKYTVCVTGKIPGYTKSSLAKELEKNNIKTVNTVNKNIDYLICNDPKHSSKETKADTLGIPIVSLEQLLTIIGEK